MKEKAKGVKMATKKKTTSISENEINGNRRIERRKEEKTENMNK